jgi:hypothetical protein
MQDSHRTAVERFFDAHPINEDEILTKLRAKGLDLDSLSEAELQEFDQDHYGGTDAVDALAREANIGPALRLPCHGGRLDADARGRRDTPYAPRSLGVHGAVRPGRCNGDAFRRCDV